MFTRILRPKGRTLDDGALLAVDVETTGLKPGVDQMVSIGWVPVNSNVIDLSAAEYFVLAGVEIGDSATIHGVTDDDVARFGKDPAEVLAAFERAFERRKLLAHFAQMETGFIGQLFSDVRRERWRLREDEVVDTMTMERRHMERMGTYPRGEDLRLARVRHRYNLPHYGNHNALTDAIACAELYLAIDASQRR